MALFFVCVENKVDRRDDNVLKIKAKSKKDAKVIAYDYIKEKKWKDYQNIIEIGRVFSKKEFLDFDPEWHALLWGRRIVNEGQPRKRRKK